MKNQTGAFSHTIKVTLLKFYSRFIFKNIQTKILLFVIAVFCSIGIGSIKVTSQDEEIITHKKFADNEPVKLVSIKTEQKELSLEKAFPKTSDWYKGLEFEIENISDKTITFITIELRFARPKDLKETLWSDKYPFAMDIHHGGYLKDFLENKESGVAIKPGEIVKIPLKENIYKGMNESLTRLGYPSKFKGVEIIIQEVGFSDRSLWSYGLIYRQDPKDPAKWPPVLEKIDEIILLLYCE
jgi:hypothetical protein